MQAISTASQDAPHSGTHHGLVFCRVVLSMAWGPTPFALKMVLAAMEAGTVFKFWRLGPGGWFLYWKLGRRIGMTSECRGSRS